MGLLGLAAIISLAICIFSYKDNMKIKPVTIVTFIFTIVAVVLFIIGANPPTLEQTNKLLDTDKKKVCKTEIPQPVGSPIFMTEQVEKLVDSKEKCN